MQLDKVGSEKRRIRMQKALRARRPEHYGVVLKREGIARKGLSAAGTSWRRIFVRKAPRLEIFALIVVKWLLCAHRKSEESIFWHLEAFGDGPRMLFGSLNLVA